MVDVPTLPCVGNTDFVLYEGSKVIIQGDSLLPPRIAEYLNDTLGSVLKARCCSEPRLVEIVGEDPTTVLKALYSKKSLFRYTHKYFVVQEDFPQFSWSVVESLSGRLGIDLATCTLRLSVFPRVATESIVDIVYPEIGDRLSPTNYTHILSVVRYSDVNNPNQSMYRVGFAPGASGLDHEAAFEAMEDHKNVSRAFYKIQEACERCGVKQWPQPSWNALDIGAAPGGWSLYLSEVVGKVYAVDPAVLEVQKPNIIHLQGQLLDMLPQLDGVKLHIVVCDMNEFPKVAIKCLQAIEHKLEIGGIIIWTLKYPNRAQSNIEQRLLSDVKAFHQLLPSCDVTRTMHMVSNHHERTVVAVKNRPSSELK